MHLFGMLGSLMFIAGFAVAAYLGINKLVYIKAGLRAPLVTDSPYFYIGLTAMVIGTLLFMTGFIGELINRNSSTRNEYLKKDSTW
jgi:hypothetical protein